MASTIKLKTSTSSGNVPASLSKGEVAINVADGVWYYGGASAVQQNFKFGSVTVTGDTSLDGKLVVTGNTVMNGTLSASSVNVGNGAGSVSAATITASGEIDGGSLDIEGDADINGTTNLDEVDVDGDITMANGKQLFLGSGTIGDPSITFLTDTDTGIRYQTNTLRLVVGGADQVAFSDGAIFPLATNDIDLGLSSGYYFKNLYIGNITSTGTTNLDNTDIDGTLVVDGTNISLDSTSTLNIDNSNTSNGITIGTATSGVPIQLGHATSKVRVNDDLIVTGNTTVDGVMSATTRIQTGNIQAAANTITTGSGDLTIHPTTARTLYFGNGEDGGAHDVQFYGAEGNGMLWDQDIFTLNITGNLTVSNNIDFNGGMAVDGGTISLDATSTLNIDNSNTSNGITIGTATSGVPIQLGHSTSKVRINDDLIVTGNTVIDGTLSAVTSITTSGNLDIDGTTNLDAVDIDGNVQLDGTLTVGVDGTGQDVKFFGATAGKYMLWDEDQDSLFFPDDTKIVLGTGSDTEIQQTGSETIIKDASTGNIKLRAGTVTVQNGAGSKTMGVFNGANKVELFYNNNSKFETTNTGVDVTGDVLASGALVVTGNTTLNGTLSATTSCKIGNGDGLVSAATVTASGSITAGNGEIENGLISAGTVNGSYQYVGFMSSIAGSYMTTNDWILPSIGGGISNHTWNQNTNYLGSNNTVGVSKFTLVNGMAHIGIPVPFDGYVKGFYCTCRNNGGANNPRNAGLFVGTNNWGSSSFADVTLRAYAAGDDASGNSNSKPYKIDGMLTTAYKVSEGDIVLPAMYSPDADNVATQCTWTVVFKT